MGTIGDVVAQWHVAFCAPNAESKADISLRREGYATFLPMDRVRKRRQARGRPGHFVIDWLNIPLYPRYIFFGARPGHGLYAANEADGVSTLLYFGEHPVIVPHRVMDEIMMRADSDGIVSRRDETLRPRFTEGTKVRFAANSPFANFVGMVSRDSGREVKVWLDALGATREVSVDASLLSPVESAP